jgi:hypothetical protein
MMQFLVLLAAVPASRLSASGLPCFEIQMLLDSEPLAVLATANSREPLRRRPNQACRNPQDSRARRPAADRLDFRANALNIHVAKPRWLRSILARNVQTTARGPRLSIRLVAEHGGRRRGAGAADAGG